MPRLVSACLLFAACGNGGAPARQDAAAAVPARPAAPPVASGAPDVEARLAKLERTVARLTAALDRQLGPVPPDPQAVYAIPIDPRDPVDGPADAKVTLVFAFDLVDPATAQLAPIVLGVAGKHPADVRVAWKYLTLGPAAIGPGLVACGAAAQKKWPAVRDALLKHLFTPEPHPERAAFDQLVPLATAAGVDAKQLATDRAPCEAWLDADKTALAAAGTYTTPALYANGKILPGVRDAGTLDTLVTAAIAQATQDMAAHHVAAADFYQQEVLAKGRTKISGRFDDETH